MRVQHHHSNGRSHGHAKIRHAATGAKQARDGMLQKFRATLATIAASDHMRRFI